MIGTAARDLETPALIVDLEILQTNIDKMAGVFRDAGVAWRPHTKSIKSPALAHKLLQSGAIGVTCAKVGEAEAMAAAGIRDILIANQIVGLAKTGRLAALGRHADPIATVDSAENVRELNAAAQQFGVRLRTVIEVDCGLGRCGVQPGRAAVELARKIDGCRGLTFSGVATWEGQTVRVALPERPGAVEATLSLLTDTADACRRAGLAVSIVSCGGTGDYWISARVAGVTEIEAGGGIFGDRYYLARGVDHPLALTVLSTVISRPTSTRVVTDAGRKAILPDDHAEPWPKDVAGVERVRLTAEHGQFEMAQPSLEPRIGNKIEWYVGYSDMTVFLHDEMYAVRNGLVEAIWPILARATMR